jgi:hypothetical protein
MKNTSRRANVVVDTVKSGAGMSFGLLALGLSMSSNIQATQDAPTARYLIQYHSPSIVKDAALQLKSQNSALSLRGQRGVIRVTNHHLKVEDALQSTRMLVVEATEAQAQSLTQDPNVALVEKEFFYSSPEPMSTRGSL